MRLIRRVTELAHGLWLVVGLAAGAGLLAGCSDLTEVDAPDVVLPDALDNPTGALVRRAGAIGKLATAFSLQAAHSGILADEFADRTANIISDRRTITPDQDSRYPYGSLSSARINALRAITTLQHFNPDPPERIGELFALVGYVELMFAENMCAGVPLGDLADDQVSPGQPRSRAELLERALADFDSAASYATGSETILNLARVGRGRTLLARGDVTAAGDAVATVPIGFAYQVQYATNGTQSNRVYQLIGDAHDVSVADGEGGNGLPFISAADPRLPTQDIGPGSAGGRVYNFAGNTSVAAPIMLASGVEAYLIRAEAALGAGQPDAAASLLNDLRAQAITPAMAALSTDSTTNSSEVARVDVLFRERAFWLFGTGHRHGDLRRLVRQYGRPLEGTFPTGLYQGGPLSYGTSVVFVPFGESSNPNFAGCLDLGA